MKRIIFALFGALLSTVAVADGPVGLSPPPYLAPLAGALSRSQASKNADVISILDFIPQSLHAGIAAGTDSTDLSSYFTASLSGVNTGATYTGKPIRLARGKYNICSVLTITTTESSGTASIEIIGDGQHNTEMNFACNPTSGADGIAISGKFGVKLRDMKVAGAKGANVHVSSSAFIELSHMRLQASVGDGLKVDGGSHNIIIDSVWSLASGANGFNLGDKSTTINARSSYAQSSGQAGWLINDLAYSSFTSLGSDSNAWGYSIQNVRGLSCIACGAEMNYFEGFTIQSASSVATGKNYPDIKGLTLISPFAYGNTTGSTAGNNFANINAYDASINMTIIGASDILGTGVTKSLSVTGTNGKVVEISPALVGTTTYAVPANQTHLP